MSRRGGRGNMWNKSGRSHGPTNRPPGLKGREIGLFYRDLALKKAQDPSRIKDNWSHKVHLQIPPAVISKVQANLNIIKNRAKTDKINIPIYQNHQFMIKNERDVVEALDVDCHTQVDMLKVEREIKTEAIPGCSTEMIDETNNFIPIVDSSKDTTLPIDIQNIKTELPMPDFIPIPNDEDLFKIPSEKCLSLRGASDYKYGYDDIITGSFEEKLNESVSKGIEIKRTSLELMNLSIAMHEEYQDMTLKPAYKKYMKFRETLPTYKKAEEILDAINNNQVVVITGETGCGKSTQVPQLILDHAIINNSGANIRIEVTQPRRIAASSLAMRVAEERAEKMGNSVGYAVRLEKVEARARGSIMFCTTGVLLADLEVKQGLTNVSHIILDEVHERDCHIDLTLCMLKQVIKKRKDLKLILMSATIDANRLAAYYDNCPTLHIEGLAYPVQDVYLEDILEITHYRLPEKNPDNNFNTRGKQKRRFHGRGRNPANKEMERKIQYNSTVGPWLESIRKNVSRNVYDTVKDHRIENLNIDLIHSLLLYLCKGPSGAILVFLPGIGDISKLLKMMELSKMFPSSRYEIYPLHSKLPSLEQHKIFERPPEHIRKIIVATNIAETSITIDDIVYVIDCGKVKMTGRNVDDNVSTLQMEWVSQANLKQRRGRAGRCQAGICYHLITSFRASTLPERHLPELQRSNLLEPVLSIKRLRLGKAENAFKLVPDQPPDATVKWAVNHLQQLGALDDTETLTPLGWHIARLPVHPAAGKLLLLGALFGCLDRAASVAAVWGFKDPFHLVIGKEQLVDKAKRSLALGEPSDHMAMSEAIIQWEGLRREDQRPFEYDYFLSHNTLQQLSDMKNQCGDSLRQMGFLNSGSIKGSWENRNAGNLSLFKALVAASLYPNVGRVKWSNLNRPMKRKRITCHTPEDGHISLHPSSIMCRSDINLCSNPGANWLVYWLKQRSTDLFIIDVTLVYTLPLLFFGDLNNITEADNKENCLINICSIKVECKKETADVLMELRGLLNYVLANKVTAKDHGVYFSDFEESILNTVMELITAEDERSETLGDEDLSDSEHSEFESSSSKRWY